MKITNIPVSWYMWHTVNRASCLAKKDPPSPAEPVGEYPIVEPIETYNKFGKREYKFSSFKRHNIAHDEKERSHNGKMNLCKRFNKTDT